MIFFTSRIYQKLSKQVQKLETKQNVQFMRNDKLNLDCSPKCQHSHNYLVCLAIIPIFYTHWELNFQRVAVMKIQWKRLQADGINTF